MPVTPHTKVAKKHGSNKALESSILPCWLVFRGRN